MMTGMVSPKMITDENVPVDMRVSHNTGARTGVMKVETGVIKIGTDPILHMKKESAAFTLEIPTPEVGVHWLLQDPMTNRQTRLHSNTLM